MEYKLNSLATKNTSNNYDATYFNWQRDSGIFGGIANTHIFRKFIKSQDTVIDFGCGGGYLLKNLNCKIKIGIEINSNAHQQIKKNKVFPYKTSQELLKKTGEEFADVIISNNALEHTPNPLLELKALYPILKKGGKIHFVVPCDNINFKWKPNDINFHLYSWSPMNIGNLFIEAGYNVVFSKPYIHKWPPFYKFWQKIFGWKIFNLICRIYGLIDRRWFQVEILATK